VVGRDVPRQLRLPARQQLVVVRISGCEACCSNVSVAQAMPLERVCVSEWVMHSLMRGQMRPFGLGSVPDRRVVACLCRRQCNKAAGSEGSPTPLPVKPTTPAPTKPHTPAPTKPHVPASVRHGALPSCALLLKAGLTWRTPSHPVRSRL